ncbi:universal stress protein [Mesorhizobium sp. BAC0120]|uniref:universal stress protein n=1 Tax=Mesorhizobium sp. BAC0120 TaxID=3090670 RepID=UPI00298CB8C7|nr:universal stress protein [Mesorhizobium sp. BAC0120]MDW6021541.1 universal stress protein [Mesorhizobium sp. BAC0120]
MAANVDTREAQGLSSRRGDHLLRALRKGASAAGLGITTEEITTAPALLCEATAIRARLFDLVLLGWEAGNATSRMAAEALIFDSGRPTILLPELYEVRSIDQVAIAWNGSRVAARAVADAHPFLKAASRIFVLTVRGDKPLLNTDVEERLVDGLRKRGCTAEPVPMNAEDCPIGVLLQERAIELGCNLLVMGGFGHSRIREFVLGSATEDVLSDLRLPTLLSH